MSDWWELDVTHRGFRFTGQVIGDREFLEKNAKEAIDWWIDERSGKMPDNGPLAIYQRMINQLMVDAADYNRFSTYTLGSLVLAYDNAT